MDDRPPRRTPPMGHQIPHVVPQHIRDQTAAPVCEADDEVTGNHVGAELARERAKRPTDERIGRLEVKHDALATSVADVREVVGRVEGQLQILPQLVDEIRQSANRAQQRDHVVFTGQMEVDTARRKATISDEADVKRTRRALVAKAIGGVAALLTSGAALHWLMGKL